MIFNCNLRDILLVVLCTTGSGILGAPTNSKINKRAVDQATFDELTRSAKFAREAYIPLCPRPVGKQVVRRFNNAQTGLNAYIAMDPEDKEIVVAFQRTASLKDITIDGQADLIPWVTPGSEGCENCTIHTGFQVQWGSEAANIIAEVTKQAAANPDYNIMVTGHSLGGALTSVAGTAMIQEFPGKVTAYSFASPRVDDPNLATHIEGSFPEGKLFRVTHTDDIVPQDLSPEEGYAHHGPEFFIESDPASLATIKQCKGGEDPTCNAGVAEANAGLLGINAAHFDYVNINFALGDLGLCFGDADVSV